MFQQEEMLLTISIEATKLPMIGMIEINVEVLPSGDAQTSEMPTICHHSSSKNSRASYKRCTNRDSFNQVTHPRILQFYLYEKKMEHAHDSIFK